MNKKPINNNQNKGQRPILTKDEWEQVADYYYSPVDEGKKPTYEDCLDFILKTFNVRFDSTKSIERHMPKRKLNFGLSKRQVLKKLSPHYYSPNQINTFFNIVDVSIRKGNQYVIQFIEAKLRFEMEQQDLDLEDRFPTDPIQQAWIDLYVSLDVLGEYLDAQDDCLKLQDLIKTYRPWYSKKSEDFGFDVKDEEWINGSYLKKFRIAFMQLYTAIRMASGEEFQEVVLARKRFKRESKEVTRNIVKKLSDKAYEMGVQTPVHLIEKDSLQVWIEELISRLPEPTRPKKEITTLRNELKEYRLKKLNPDDYVFWNVIIKVFEKAKTNTQRS